MTQETTDQIHFTVQTVNGKNQVVFINPDTLNIETWTEAPTDYFRDPDNMREAFFGAHPNAVYVEPEEFYVI